jgi:hypothetical protein
VRIYLSKRFLENLCAVLKSQFKGELNELLIAPSGTNQFRVRARMPNSFASWLGSGFLKILSEEGVEIEIEQPQANSQKPFKGSLVTGFLGKTIIPQLVKAINQGFGVGKVLKMSSEVFKTTTNITLDPIPLFQKFLPLGIGDHITSVEWTASYESIVFTFNWQHSGSRRKTQPMTSGGKPMDQQMQQFLDDLVNSQFVEMRGSWANLHLELPEKLLNEAAKALTANKGPNANKWLAMVQSANVKGSISVDLKLNA